MRLRSGVVVRIGACLLAGLAGGGIAEAQRGGTQVQPVYVGSRVCGECHYGDASGNQYAKWLQHPHSRAYSSLWSQEAKEIATLSGVPEEPQESLVCLGCHATAWDTEGWERDDSFLLQDGVQCERCHGPGSEYMAANVMLDPEESKRRGLRYPDESECRKCHQDKGSHTAVLGPSGFDAQEWWKRLAHPTPEDGFGQQIPRDDVRITSHRGDPADRAYAGVERCRACHGGPAMGYQFSRWKEGPHARAYASLATRRARELAAEAGIEGEPIEAPACLRCHTTAAHAPDLSLAAGFDFSDGVGCEACHGAGSVYADDAMMADCDAAVANGLTPVPRETCLPCHEEAHGAPFDIEAALAAIAHPTHLAGAVTPKLYKTPLNLAVTADGRELWIACEASDSVIVVDTASRRKAAEIVTGGQATDVTFSRDGSLAWVSNRLGDTVTVVDVAKREVVETFATGDEPHGVLFDASGENLYVLNTGEDSISIFDAATRREKRRLAAGRNPWSLALSPDGRTLAVTNTLAQLAELRQNSHSEVTLIDVASQRVVQRLRVPDANLCQGIAWHPSGRFAFLTLNRTKNLLPITRLVQGWTITNGFGIVWADGRVDQALLDEPGMCFPDTADVAFSPDGRWAFFTSSGSDRVAVVDVPKLIGMLEEATDHRRAHVFPNHTGLPCEFVVKHIPTKNSPRGVTFAPDGRTAYVANSLADSVTVIDVATLEAVGEIDLGGAKEITQVRYGEQVFHSADIAFHRQFSCHSCHPDGNVDGITYDIEADGIGTDPVDNRTLRGILDTDPFKWSGINPTLERQCGPRLAVFFTRTDPFSPEELAALTRYICTIPRPPNRFRPLGADLTPAQRRGKRVFDREWRNDGSEIPPNGRCVTCHFPPLYTDRAKHDVGNLFALDTKSIFDTPHLNNIYETPPYLHNGAALTLEEIWTKYNPYDEHGVTNDLTKDQLNDLIEFLKTL